MDIIPFARSIRQHYRRKRGYNRLSSPNRRTIKVVRFGGKSSKRSWRLRLVPRLRLTRLPSPLKLWYRFKNAYMNMMLKLAATSGSSNSVSTFGSKRIPSKARHDDADQFMNKYSRSEFENRLIFEIYKNMVPSYELGYINK